MTRLLISWLLPLFLLFTQQGVLLHDIRHLVDQEASGHARKHADGTPCDECLAFAQLANASTAQATGWHLLTQLAHQWVPHTVAQTLFWPTPAQRSRSPPSMC